MNCRILGLAGVAAALIAGPAFAHHSFAMFDASKLVKLQGTVKEYEWLNPHSWVHVVIMENGKAVTYSFEGGSTGQLTQSGWKPDSVKPGDKVTVGFHPLKDGSHGGQLIDLTLPDGKTLCQGADCRRAQPAPG